jgi:type IV pilus assembly protein PilE
MVVIAIVGILFGIALSSYQSNVLKTRRYAAQSCLMEYSQYMERHYTTNTSNPMQYTGASLPSAACATSLGATYTISLSLLSSQAYTLQAAALGAQTGDAGCTAMTLQTSVGTKMAARRKRARMRAPPSPGSTSTRRRSSCPGSARCTRR